MLLTPICNAAYSTSSLSPPGTVWSQQGSLSRPKATFLTLPWVALSVHDSLLTPSVTVESGRRSARSAVRTAAALPGPRVAGPVAAALSVASRDSAAEPGAMLWGLDTRQRAKTAVLWSGLKLNICLIFKDEI